MSLMPDFQQDLERASQRWQRPAARLLRGARPVVGTVAIVAALGGAVILWPQSQEREISASPGQATTSRPASPPAPGATLAQLLGPDAPAGPFPDAAKAAVAHKQSYRLHLNAAYAVEPAPGQDVVTPGLPPPNPSLSSWYVIEGDIGFCAIFGNVAATCDSDSSAVDALRAGPISLFNGNRTGRPQLLGIVEDGVRAVRAERQDGTVIAQADVRHNAYRIVLPERYGAGDSGPFPLVLIRGDGSTQKLHG